MSFLKLSSFETKLREQLNVEISGRGENIEVPYFFHWAEEFNEIKEKFKNMVEWEDFLFGLINPRLNQSIQFLNQNLQGEYAQTWNNAFPEYRQILENVLALDAILHEVGQLDLPSWPRVGSERRASSVLAVSAREVELIFLLCGLSCGAITMAGAALVWVVWALAALVARFATSPAWPVRRVHSSLGTIP